MLDEVIIAGVLIVMLAETVRGLVKWRSGGKETVCIGLTGAVPCVYYLTRDYISEGLGFAFVVITLGGLWGWFFALSRRRIFEGWTTNSKKSLIISLVFVADLLAIGLVIAAIGHPILVVATFAAIHLVAAVLSVDRKVATPTGG